MHGRFALQAFLFALCLLSYPYMSCAKPTGLEKRYLRGSGFANRGGSNSGRMNDLRPLNNGNVLNFGRFGEAVNVVIDRQRIRNTATLRDVIDASISTILRRSKTAGGKRRAALWKGTLD
ncbi:hypothetical protein L249_5760 [Ophiocordyceps polyrhachis-furcata BCC 54312]|uniref:Uncharacterized protein n=1 Tax=Ophiocordyceps polyrhachis-furcata BCC 54312 TaxID=1330021 RepID=A0A367KZX7_9HYPO|nr:hypothetical protein L249_5760 [Ophiocordyceps polyrhachis-furcata BCC 54312]